MGSRRYSNKKTSLGTRKDSHKDFNPLESQEKIRPQTNHYMGYQSNQIEKTKVFGAVNRIFDIKNYAK